MKQRFADLPVLSCFEFGGKLFEKQTSQWCRNIDDGILAFFHNDDEVFVRVPDAWRNGKPLFSAEVKTR